MKTKIRNKNVNDIIKYLKLNGARKSVIRNFLISYNNAKKENKVEFRCINEALAVVPKRLLL